MLRFLAIFAVLYISLQPPALSKVLMGDDSRMIRVGRAGNVQISDEYDPRTWAKLSFRRGNTPKRADQSDLYDDYVDSLQKRRRGNLILRTPGGKTDGKRVQDEMPFDDSSQLPLTDYLQQFDYLPEKRFGFSFNQQARLVEHNRLRDQLEHILAGLKTGRK